MWKIHKLFAGFVWLFVLAGCTGSDQYVKTTRVETYRSSYVDPADLVTMKELCREVKDQVRRDTAQSSSLKKSEIEEFREDSEPGASEYRREYRESSRYSAAAADRDRMIQLCIDFEQERF